MAVRTVIWNGQAISYELERKAVKNINLRVVRDASVHVSANRYVPVEHIDEFVLSKAGMILSAKDRLSKKMQQTNDILYVSGEKVYIQGSALTLRVIQAKKDRALRVGDELILELKNPKDEMKRKRLFKCFMNEVCRSVCEEKLDLLCPRFEKYGVERPELKIRSMRSRWGSCHYNKGVITINSRLLAAPDECIELVVAHELCHFVHPNHSPAFYGLLASILPNWRERNAMLKKAAVYDNAR